MSDFVVHKGRRTAGSFARHYGVEVTEVRYEHGARSVVLLADGRTGLGSCLGCGSTPCIEKDAAELTLFGALDDFPGDPSLDVCPTRAIRWDGEKSAALVVAEACIGCGLCISRCPYGAISLVDSLTAGVSTEDPDGLVIAGPSNGKHPEAKRSGLIANLDSPAASNLPAAVVPLDSDRKALLVRNLLNEVGLNARTKRLGDTNMRIDVVGFSRRERPFVAEIEFGSDVLESPRALLEDVAVLHSRYGYAVDGVDPVSIVLFFPNVRSDYYQVICDIEAVLGVRCRTITIGMLVALLWNCARLEGFHGDDFTAADGASDLAACLGVDGANLVEPYPGAFRPAK